MEPTPARKPARTAEDRRFALIIGVAVAAAAGFLALAVARTNTDDQTPAVVASRPDIVEHLIPLNNAQVQRQSELGIDLAPGYEAALVVDGTAIPEDQLRLVPQQNQVFFTPGEGKAIEELDAGQTCVTAIVWQSAVGRGSQDKSFQWCFNVT